jgi:GMP synthase-like glutamine amidotransferase
MRIHTIEHVPFEGPGAIAQYALDRGHALTRTPIYLGAPLPALEEVDLIVIMGGPMSVHDEDRLDWLRTEKRYLRQAVDAGTRLLGVCLGAQLLAEVLGGRVMPNDGREIGWFPVRLTAAGADSSLFSGFGPEFPAFHWHGETFSIPPGAAWVAESDACRHQAFEARGRIVGLQFHLETTPESMEQLIANCADELEPRTGFMQTADEMRARQKLTASTWPLLFGLLDNLMGE